MLKRNFKILRTVNCAQHIAIEPLFGFWIFLNRNVCVSKAFQLQNQEIKYKLFLFKRQQFLAGMQLLIKYGLDSFKKFKNWFLRQMYYSLDKYDYHKNYFNDEQFWENWRASAAVRMNNYNFSVVSNVVYVEP